MTLYKSTSPAVQVNGGSVLAIVAGMGMFKARALQILAECGIADPKPEQWYSQQSFLDAFRKIARAQGPAVLNMIGRKIPDNAHFPPQISTIERGLQGFCEGYKLNHRGDDSMVFDFRLDGERAAKITLWTAYPCAFERGIIEAMANRFKPVDSKGVRVAHAADKCRDQGAECCTYRVTW